MINTKMIGVAALALICQMACVVRADESTDKTVGVKSTFEDYTAGEAFNPAGTSEANYWSDITEATVTAYAEEEKIDAYGNNYLAIDDGSVTRYVNSKDESAWSKTEGKEIYFEGRICMTVRTDEELPSDAKVIVWLSEDGKVMVTANGVADGTLTDTATNYDTSIAVPEGTWCKLKIQTATAVLGDTSVPGFEIFIDDNPVTGAPCVAAGAEEGATASVFPSLAAASSVASIVLTGTGGVDSLAFTEITTVDPNVDTSWYNENASSFTLTDAADLAGFAKLVNAGTTFSGKTLTLGADIDLSGTAWAGIGIYNESAIGTAAFQGIFDGIGKKISNVTFANTSSNKYRGFFNQIANATIKNLTVEVLGFEEGTTGTYGGAVIVGHAISSMIEDCVAEGKLNVTHNAAGIVVSVTAGENLGCTIRNCTNKAALTSNYTKMGGIAAFTQTGTGNVIEGCVNKGAITSIGNREDSGRDGVGGIVGWVGYPPENAYPLTIRSCTNTGLITKSDGNTTAMLGQLVGVNTQYTTFEGTNKGSASMLAVGNSGNASVVSFATVENDIATYTATLEAGNTYLVTASGTKPTIALNAGEFITFDTSLAAIDASGITAAATDGVIIPPAADATVVTYTSAVAKIGEMGYASIAEAVEEANPGDTITVLSATVAWEGVTVKEGVVFKQGTGVTDPSAPADYKWVDGELVAKNYVARVGDAKYETLAEAMDEAGGETVTLLADITISEKTYVKSSLDLAGKTITVNSNGDGLYVRSAATISNGKILANTPNGQAIVVSSDTILDNMVIEGDSKDGLVRVINSAGNLVINAKTTIKATGTNIAVSFTGGGDVEINGTVTAVGSAVSTSDNTSGNLTINEGAEISGATAIYVNGGKVNVTGGTITGALQEIQEDGLVISGGMFTADPSTQLVEGYVAVAGENGYTVVPTAAKIGETYYLTLAEAIAAAEEGAVITLFAGTHTMPGSVVNKNITIKGDANTDKTTIVVEMLDAVGATGSTIAFEHLTAKFDNDNYEGLQHAAMVTYTDCTHFGTQFLYAPTVEFTNCTFEMYDAKTEYAVWTYGAKDVKFNNCVFNTNGKAILVYHEEAIKADIALSKCEFNSNGTYKDKAAVELGQSANGAEASYNLTFIGCTADKNFSANNTESNLWGNKNDMTTASGGGSSVTITTNGVESENLMPEPEPVCATIKGQGKMTLSAALAYANQNAGSVITLDKDTTIELANWTAVDMTKAVVIEGNGATITGLTESLVNGTICQITIKDLTISGANIAGKYSGHSGENNAGAFIGVAAHSTAVLTNCHVLNSVIGSSSDYYAGGLVGYWGGNSTLTVDGCSVINTKITAESSVGGMVGHAYDGLTILNSKVGGNTITSTDAEVRPDKAGAVIGRNNGGTDSIDVVETAVSTMNPTGTKNENRVIGSIVGGSVVITGGEYFADPTLVEKDTLPTVDGEIVAKDGKFIVAKAQIGEGDAAIYYTTIQAAIYATADDATDAATITVLGNVTEAMVTVKEGKNVVIDFGGKTLNGSMFVKKGATADIKNGKIYQTASVSGIEVQGVATLTDMDITSEGRHAIRVDGLNTEGTKLTVNSGTYTTTASPSAGSYYAVNAGEKSVVEIKGGKFVGNGGGQGAFIVKSNDTLVTIEGGEFYNGDAIIMQTCDSTVITGGTYGGKDGVRPAAGYRLAYDEANGVYEVVQAVAKIGDVYYDSLAEAIAAAEDGAVITLFAGTHTMPGSVANKNITIKGDANAETDEVVVEMLTSVNATGSTIAFEHLTAKFDNDGYEGLQHCTSKITYTDCIHIGTEFLYAPEVVFTRCTFEMLDDKTEYAVWTYGAENVTFKDCTFNTNGKAILVYNESSTNDFVANVELTDCQFNSTGKYTDKAAVELGQSPYGVNAYNLTFTDCKTDGKFYANNTNNQLWGNKHNMTTASGNGGSSVIINGSENVMPKPAVATVTDAEGTTVTKYETLQAAIDAAKDGETVTLLADLAVAETVTIGKAITLDLNDKTISAAEGVYLRYLLNVGNVVVIENGTVTTAMTQQPDNGPIYPAAIGVTGQLTLNGVTVNGCHGVNVGCYQDYTSPVAEGASAVLNDCTINVNERAVITQTTGKIEINNTKMVVAENQNFGIYMANGTVDFNADSELLAQMVGVVMNSDSVFNMNGGLVSAEGHGFEIYGGALNVTGGEITTIGETDDVSDADTVVALEFDGFFGGNDGNASTLTMTGGKLSSLDPNAPIIETGNNETGKGYVSGGTFSAEIPAEYIADGYELKDNGDGTFTVVQDKYVASVTAPDGTVTKYTDVTAAIEAATGSNTSGNYTVTLLKDCTSGMITGFGAVQSAVLDLNGKTLTIPTYFYVANHDTLTIKDSSVEQTGTVLCTNIGGISVSAPNGTLIVESGTLTHDENFTAGYAPINQFGSGKVYINGGHVIAEDGWYAVGSGTAGVKGGTIEINDGTVEGAVYLAATSGVDTLALNGDELDVTLEVKPGYAGTITKAANVTVDAPADYRWVEQDDGTQMLTKIPYVAELTDKNGKVTKFESFNDAYKTASNNGGGNQTIKLLDDGVYSLDDLSWTGGCVNLTLDLNGHNLTLEENMKLAGTAYGGNTLTIDDKSKDADGQIVFAEDSYIEFINDYSDTLIVNGGTFVKDSDSKAAIVDGSWGTVNHTVTFNGGNFDQVAGDVFDMDKGDNVTKGENVEVKAPEGYEWNEDGKLVVGYQEPVCATVTGVEDKMTLSAALAYAKANVGDVVITLDEDATIDLSRWTAVNLDGSANVTLEGNGATITNLPQPLFVRVGGYRDVTIRNLTVKNADIQANWADGNGSAGALIGWYDNYTKTSVLTIENCHAADSTVANAKNAGSQDYAGGLIGYITSTGTVLVDACSVKNTTVTAAGSVGGLVGHTDKLTVKGAVVEGNTIKTTGSNLTKEGVVVGTANGTVVIDATEDAKSTGTGDLNVIGRAYLNVTFNGGAYFTDPRTASATNENTAILIEDMIVERDDKYFVLPAVAQVGNVKYATVQEAINAAEAGQTVTILKDVEEKGTEVEVGSGEFFIQILGKAVVVDLDGFTLKGSFYLNSGAALTIDNGAIESLDGNKSSCIESVGGKIVLGEKLSAHSSVRHAIRVKGGTAEIKGGTYVADGNSTYHVVNVSHASTVTINGGTFTSNKGNSTSGGNAVMIQDSESKVAINGGTFTNAAGVEGCICAAAGLTISGGTFDTWTYDQYLAEGCWAFQKYRESGDVGVKKLFFVAQKKDAPQAKIEKIDNPTVTVEGIGEVTLESTYSFKALHLTGEDALNSQYSTWHADFEVSVDKDIPANSIVLAGNYGSYGWLAFTNPEAITAGTTIRLLKDVASLSMNYYELCTLVKEFKCGVTDINGVLDGVNFTVKLNMYPVKPYTDSNTNWNIEDTNAEPITSNAVTFELGSNRNYVAQFGDAKYETIDEAITAAKAAPAEDGKKNVVTVLDGEVEWAEDFTYDEEVEIHLADGLDASTATAPGGCAWVGGVLMMPTNWLHVADTRWYNAEATAFTLSTEEELAGVAKLVNGGNTFAGKKITLGRDMDLARLVWPGIGIYKGNSFQGTFNGAAFRVSNMNLSDDSNGNAASEANNYRGFFNYIDNATITDLTVAGDVWATAPASTEYGGALIAGHANNSTIEGCVAEGSVNGTHNVAGVVVRVEDSQLIACINEANVTGSYSKMGGIAALVQNSETSVLFDGCVNEGPITSTARGEDGVGGIVGWVGYPNTANVTVQNCENKGTITATETATVGQIAAESWDGKHVFTGNKGLTTIVATGHSAMDGLNFATVENGVATYVKNAELAAGNSYLVTAEGAKPVITLAAGQSITFDLSLAEIDETGITAATELKKTTEDNRVTYTAKAYVVTITWPNETTTDEVADGEAFTLAAKELAGMTFIGWSGAYASTAAEAQITVTGDVAITANYLPSELYTEVKDTIEENYKNDNELVNVNDIVNLSLQNPTIQVGKDENGEQFADVGIKLMKATTLKDETNGGKPNWTPVVKGEPISANWAEDGEMILIRLPADKKAQFFRFVPVNGLK